MIIRPDVWLKEKVIKKIKLLEFDLTNKAISHIILKFENSTKIQFSYRKAFSD